MGPRATRFLCLSSHVALRVVKIKFKYDAILGLLGMVQLCIGFDAERNYLFPLEV
jgi:hypothetical protein